MQLWLAMHGVIIEWFYLRFEAFIVALIPFLTHSALCSSYPVFVDNVAASYLFVLFRLCLDKMAHCTNKHPVVPTSRCLVKQILSVGIISLFLKWWKFWEKKKILSLVCNTFCDNLAFDYWHLHICCIGMAWLFRNSTVLCCCMRKTGENLYIWV